MADSSDNHNTEANVRRVTFTLRPQDIARLRSLTAWRHAGEPRSLSLTLRECIREAYERERAKQEESGK